MQSDLSYSIDGIFTQFYPNSPAGERAWLVISADTGGTGKIYTTHLASTLRQLRDAGYSVRKSRRSAPTTASEADDLIAALAS